MSKDKKDYVKLSVKNVNNLKDKLSWISTTITLQHFEKVWPMNLIKDVCNSLFDMLEINESVIQPYY